MTTPDLADRVAAATLSVPGVTGLDGGSSGVGTYLPGRRVSGVRIGPDVAEVHVVVAIGSRMRVVADAVVAAVGPLVGTPVQVVVEDVSDSAPAGVPPR